MQLHVKEKVIVNGFFSTTGKALACGHIVRQLTFIPPDRIVLDIYIYIIIS